MVEGVVEILDHSVYFIGRPFGIHLLCPSTHPILNIRIVFSFVIFAYMYNAFMAGMAMVLIK